MFTVIMWRTIVLCTIVSLIVAEKINFEHYEVYGVIPIVKEQLTFLRSWEVSEDFLFLNEPRVLGKVAGIVLSPRVKDYFLRIMKAGDYFYVTSRIKNIQPIIDQTIDNQSQWRDFGFNHYHTLEKIYKNLAYLAQQYPDKVQTIMAGTTHEWRGILGVKVSFKANNPGVFIEGGLYANEWMSPATVMYILHQLLFSNDTEVRAMAERHDWYIFPVFNPDGYVYTHTTNRFWKKTRNPHGRCVGTDLSRNWPYKWMSEGASNDPCSAHYAGSAPLSEPEARSMSEYIESISDKLYAYISFRGSSQLVTYPINKNNIHINLEDIGTYVIEALQKRNGTVYQLESMTDKDAGNIISYIRSTYNIPIAFNYGSREDINYFPLLLPPDHIIPTGEEIVDSLVVLFQTAKAFGYPKEEKNLTTKS